MTEIEAFWFQVSDVLGMPLCEIHNGHATFKDTLDGIHRVSYYIAKRFMEACEIPPLLLRDVPAY